MSAEDLRAADAEAPREPLKVLHRDDDFIAIDKPPGVLVHRTRESTDRDAIVQRLREQIGAFVYPVHRLDRAASGVLVFALSSAMAAILQAALGREDTRKTYITLVRGETEEHGESSRPLTSDEGRKQEARTSYERLATFRGFSLLRVRIYTGRRHQIRRHLSHLAHQIIGDTSYGKGRLNQALRDEYGLPRLCLHAIELAFVDPRRGEDLLIRAPLAADLRAFFARLGLDPEVLATL